MGRREGANRVKIGTVVLMKEDNLTPLQLNLVKAVQLHTGRDSVGHIMSAKGQFMRTVSQ